MRYIPHTSEDLKKMHDVVGVKDASDLFQSIPENFRLKNLLNLPTALSEQDLIAHLKSLSRKNETVDHYSSFLGAGAYHHYIPVAVNYLTGRGEFSTSYTPYQPELSQGTLQAIFEFQTMIASLMGLDIANASNYDGATALAEAVLMALRINKKKNQVILSRSIHPEYREVVRTTIQNLGYEIKEVGWNSQGQVDTQKLATLLNDQTAVFCVQSPNFFGVVEDWTALGEQVHQKGSLFVTATGDPISLGMLASPGSCGADIAVAEGQPFGNFLNLGGPYLGLFATKKEFVRQMPGRLVGETVDSRGARGFVLTLSTREQHIRREKATSNICTNQSLCALTTAIYLALLGPQGLKKLSEMNFAKAQYAKKILNAIPGVKVLLQGETYHEFALELPVSVEDALQRLQEQKIFGGLGLKRFYPEFERGLLVCVTEMVTKHEIDRFAETLKRIVQ